MRPALLFILALGLAMGLATTASAATYAGRPVRAVLEELQATGLILVYNDSLVPPDLKVLKEPSASGGIPLLNEILAPQGLTTRSMGAQTWAIVSVPSGTPALAADRDRASDRRRPTALEEVIVTASQYQLASDGPAASTLLTQQELRSQPVLADEPLRAVHRLPGAASNGLSGLPNIRGGEENETQILLDGMPLQDPFHLRGFFNPVSFLDMEIVGGLDVYSGGFPVDYGGRMGAVVDARSVDPAADGSYALGLSLFHLNALAGATFADDRGRWLVAARRSNLSQAINVAESNLGEPKYFDTFLKTEYDLSDSTTVAAHALLAQDRLELNDSSEESVATSTNRSSYLWATVDHRWSEKLAGRALLGWIHSDNHRQGNILEPDQQVGTLNDRRDSNSTLLKLELEQGDDNLRWRAGVDAAWRTARYDYQSAFQTSAGFPFPDSPATSTLRNEQVQPDGAGTGAFVAARWRVTESLTGEVGLRWDHQTYDQADGATQLSPRVNLLYDVSAQTQVRASWGRFFQAQGIDELQVEDGIDTFFPAKRSDHFILSLAHAFSGGLSARLEAYYKDYDQLRPRFENLFEPLVLLPELEYDRVEIAASSGNIQGLEFLLQDRSALPWGWWFSYALSRAEETVDSNVIPRSWDQRNTLNGGVSWTQGPWELSLAGTWHTGWPTTPVRLAPGSSTEVLIGEQNSARFDPFRSLDLRAAYTFELGDSRLLAFVELTNSLGMKNPCCVEYKVVDTGNGSARLQQSFEYWPRFVPNIGVLWTF